MRGLRLNSLPNHIGWSDNGGLPPRLRFPLILNTRTAVEGATREPVTDIMNRRKFTLLSTATAVSAAGLGRSESHHEGFFSLRRESGHWWLTSPQHPRFFSLGLNTSGPEEVSELEIRHWQRHYGRDAREWIDAQDRDSLEGGGFNSCGTGRAGEGRPFCYVVPFSGAGRWNDREVQCDYLKTDFEEWCDHVAREHCRPLAGERDLIGYHYNDGPCWIHDEPVSEWRGPLFDGARLRSKAGRRELRSLARRYYQATAEAIRRYDGHHLILGDRYVASSPLPREIYEEALARVDVLSFQDFQDPVGNLRAWYELTGKPVLLADTARLAPRRRGAEVCSVDAGWYRSVLRGSLANPGCVGCHLTGAEERPACRRVNAAARRWVAGRRC